jgi:hypothetical protein
MEFTNKHNDGKRAMQTTYDHHQPPLNKQIYIWNTITKARIAGLCILCGPLSKLDI